MGSCSSKCTDEISAKPPKDGSSSPHTVVQEHVQAVETQSTIPSSIQNDDFHIPIKIFLPPKSTTPIKASVFFIHGGIFSNGDCHSHPTISQALASLSRERMGLAVVTASFRNGEDAPHETKITMRDLRDVVDFCRGTWKGVPFGLVGSSSGGFFALNLSQILGPTIISFCIPICPVADPHKRASYLRSSISGNAKMDGYSISHDATKSSRMLEKQLSFWMNDESMKEAGESLKTNQHPDIPTLLIIGAEDKNVPFSVTADVQSWATRTIVVGGKGHELCDEIVERGGYHCYLADIERFLEYCCHR